MKNFLLVLLSFFSAITTVAQSNTKVKSKASTSLAYLKTYDKRYPNEVKLFSKPQFLNRVKALTGTRYALLKRYWDLEIPIEITAGSFIAYACQQHNCDVTNFMIIYDFANDKMYVGIREEDKVKTYSENGNSFPARLNQWATNNN
ncbi:MAG: hypothetical protein ABIQ07_11095 [Ginsengibacter sp.]